MYVCHVFFWLAGGRDAIDERCAFDTIKNNERRDTTVVTLRLDQQKEEHQRNQHEQEETAQSTLV